MPTLKDSAEFVVSINPSGVVMWYVAPSANWQEQTKFYQANGKTDSFIL